MVQLAAFLVIIYLAPVLVHLVLELCLLVFGLMVWSVVGVFKVLGFVGKVFEPLPPKNLNLYDFTDSIKKDFK